MVSVHSAATAPGPELRTLCVCVSESLYGVISLSVVICQLHSVLPPGIVRTQRGDGSSLLSACLVQILSNCTVGVARFLLLIASDLQSSDWP